MNDPTKTVGPPLTPLPARKSRGVLEKVLDNADVVIDGMYGPPQSCKRKNKEWQLVCANVIAATIVGRSLAFLSLASAGGSS
jgi:hypothetical protein